MDALRTQQITGIYFRYLILDLKTQLLRGMSVQSRSRF